MAVLVCWLVGLACGLFGLLVGLLQLLAMANMDSGKWEHFLIFVVGWSLVIGCVMGAWMLFAGPSWRRLWVVVPCGVLFAVDWWLNGLPAAQHLMH